MNAQPSRRLESSQHQKTTRAKVSDASVERLLKAVLAVWTVTIIAGLILHQDVSIEELRELKRTLPFLWFDRWLKTYGTLLPLVPFLARWMASALADRRTQEVTPALHFAEAGCLYVGISAGRLVIYFTHVVGVLHLILRVFVPISSVENKSSELMSDHLFLGASLTAILTTECVLAYREMSRALKQRKPELARIGFLGFAAIVSAGLCLGTIVDMFYTAKYFHGPVEIMGTMIFGYLLFQWPLWFWLLNQ